MPGSSRSKNEPFASSLLLVLAVEALRDQDKALLPPDLTTPNPFMSGKIVANEKTQILEHAFKAGGPVPLLKAGRTIGAVADAPTQRVFLNSANTDVLAEKWMRLERYNHSDHRVEIDSSRSFSWKCQRKWQGQQCPTCAEDLLICGIMFGLLELFGCKNLLGAVGSIELPGDLQNGRSRIAWGNTQRWTFRWSDIVCGTPTTNGDQQTLSPLPGLSSPGTENLNQLLGADLARVWRVEEAATVLGKSARSLQRDLNRSGHTFSSLVRRVRSLEACKLLVETDMSLANIGYCCGFADQSHFQRDFRRIINMTPLQYRRASPENS